MRLFPALALVATIARAQQPDPFAQQVEQKRVVDAQFAALLGAEMVVRKISYPSSDGLTIPAYLFSPRDTRTSHPLVLFVHGGVHGDFGLTHAPMVRDLVRMGCVVVAPEFRGSTGYGKAFYDAIDYGGVEVDDVTAALTHIGRFAPWADTRRTAIIGYSHGGYIALFALMRQPELFVAGVAHVPVADLPTRMRMHASSYEALFAAQPFFGGSLSQNRAPYVARSPSSHARELTRPVLVHTADNDTDVFIEENRILRDSMRSAGKDVAGLYTYKEFHAPPGGHSFGALDSPAGRESWRLTLAFLARHLGFTGKLERDTVVTIRAGLILDGRGGMTSDAIVTLRAGRIERIDRTPAGAKPQVTYELGRMTLLPGLVDAHVHLSWYFDSTRTLRVGGDVEGGSSDAMGAIAANARATLLGGVTTVQSLGNPEDGVIRDAIDASLLMGPRVLTSLQPILAPRASTFELHNTVRARRQQGADVIKLFASGGVGSAEDRLLTDDQLDAICGEASRAHLRTVVHAMSAASVRAAVRAGCTEIEHGLYASEAELRDMAQRGTWFGPQMCLVFRNYLDRRVDFERSGFTADAFEALGKALPRARDAFKRALGTRGLRVIFATDAVAGAHGRNVEELVCRVTDGGQKPMDAIVSATSRSASALGLGDQIGTIAPGFDGDLIAVDGDPTREIEALRRVRFVMRGGRVYLKPEGTGKREEGKEKPLRD